LTPADPPFVAMDPGAGPRHVAFAPSGEFVYAVNELASTVTVLAYQPGPGTLRRVQTVSTLPPDFSGSNWGAEIVADAKGRSLYVSNRGHDSIAVFGMHPDDGTLQPLQWVPSGGTTPRHFAMDPTGQWLLLANQGSDTVDLLRIDSTSGLLTPTDRSLAVASPVCIQFVSLEEPGDPGAEE
jgi:6-phosphogluconolactonase